MSNLATIVNNILADSGIDDINVVVTTGSYANPAWITSLAWTKITGAPANIVTGTGTTNYLPKFTGTSTIGNSLVYDNGTTVFVNATTAPSLGSPKFLVKMATANSYEGILVASSSNNNVIAIAHTGSIGLITTNYGTSGSNTPLAFGTNGAEQMRLDTSGNLGLNFTPSATGSNARALQLTNYGTLSGNGNIGSMSMASNAYESADNSWNRVNATSAGLYQISYTGQHSWYYTGAATANSGITWTQAMTLNASGRLGIGTTSPDSRLHVGPSNGAQLRIDFVSSGDNYYDGVTHYFRNGNGAANIMTLLNGGNVGIGTTSPNYKLEVNGSFASVTSGIFLEYSSGILYHSGGSGNYYQYISGANYLLSNRTATGALVFSTVDTERMRITSGGQFIVGDTSMAYANSIGYVAGFKSAFTGQSIISITRAGQTLASQGMFIGLDTTTSYFWNRDNIAITFGTNDTEKMRITSGGNVGIGTSSPTTKLEVIGATSNIIGYADGTIQVTSLSPIAFVATSNLNPSLNRWGFKLREVNEGDFSIYDYRSSVNRLLINSSGNVGIGTTNPAAKLHVVETSNSATTYPLIINNQNNQAGDGWGAGIKFSTSNPLGGGNEGLKWSSIQAFDVNNYGSSSGLSFTVSETYNKNTAMVINRYGGVGIGNTTPLRKLHVAGDFAVNASGSQYYGVYIPANGEGASPTILIGDWWNASGNLTWDSSNKIFNINSLYGSNAAPITFSGNGTERMRITTAGDVGIGISSPITKLQVAGGVTVGSSSTAIVNFYMTRNNGGIAADANYFVSANNTPNHTWIEGGYYTGELSGVVTAPNSGYPYIETWAGQGSSTTKSFGFINKTSGSFTSADLFVTMSLARTGLVRFNQYGAGTFTGTRAYDLSVDASGNIIEVPVGAGTITGSGTTNYVPKFTGASSIGNSTIYDDGANVGIGTTSPGARLTVQTTTSSSAHTLRVTDGTGIINIGHWDTVTNRFEFSGKPTYFVQYGTGNYISFGTLGSENMRIEAGGNIGIGTSVPSEKLHVLGNQIIGNATYDGSYGYYLRFPFRAGNLTAGTIRAHIQFDSIQDYSVNSNDTWNWKMAAVAREGNGGNYNSSLEFMRTTRIGVTDQTILALNGYTGYVGIGTTAPSQKLEIKGVDSSTVQAIFQANAGAAVAYNGGIQLGNGAGNQNSQIYHNSSGDNTLTFISNYSSGTANKFIFAPGGTERVRFLQNGNVGIGTSNPSARLSLGAASQGNRITWEDYSNIFSEYSSGDIWLSSNFYGNLGSSGYVTSSTASWGAAGISVSGTGGGLNGVIKFFVDDAAAKTAGAAFVPTERMRLIGNGNLLIGTTSATGSLNTEITINNASAGNYAGIGFKTANTNRGYIGATSTSVEIGALGFTSFYTNSLERMRIVNGGNVGIGNTSAIAKLHVTGNLLSYSEAANTAALFIAANNSYNWQFGINNGSDYVITENGGVNAIGTTRFSVKPGGNVGIGTTNPTYNLDVTGNARFTSSVTATGFFESSDARLKVVVDEDYRHNAIANIKPKFYEKNGKFEAGYIAQDVQKIYEHAVSLGTDGYLSLSYGQIHTLKIAYLEDTVEEIKRKIAYLEQQLNNK